MPKVIHLKKLFLEALERNNETIDDVICTSIPMELMEKMTTLEEIQCYYLHQHPDKQHLPLVAFTKNNIYFHHNEHEPTHILIDSDKIGVDFIPGVECYPIKDHTPYNEETIQYMISKRKAGML